jgi:hypothetical protein
MLQGRWSSWSSCPDDAAMSPDKHAAVSFQFFFFFFEVLVLFFQEEETAHVRQYQVGFQGCLA